MNAHDTTSSLYGGPKLNYITNGATLKSWLLTKDHKRIAIMYLISVSAFFLMGGPLCRHDQARTADARE